MEQRKPLLLESALGWLIKKAGEFRIPLTASLVFGFLAYGFNLTNKLVNHDEIQCLFGKGGSAILGRWGLDILERFLPNVSMPWIYGILTIVLMAVSVCVICHTFQIRRPLLQILLAGSILAFPSLTSTMAYMFTAAPYAIAFLLSVLAVRLMQVRTKISMLSALACLVLSLGIYQSYVAVTASLLLLLLIQRLLQDDDVKSAVLDGVLYVVFLGLALGCYYLITQLVLAVTGIGFSGYASGNMDLSLGDSPEKIRLAYESFGRFFRESYWGLIPTALSRAMHWCLAAAIIALLLANFIRHKNLSRILLLAALLGLLPLAINCMYLFTTRDAVHTLVLYGFIAVYVLAVILVDCDRNNAVHRFSTEIVSLVMAVILFSNLYIANTASLNLYLRYENAHSFYTALAADLKMMPQFDENTKVAIAGNYRSPDFYLTNFSDPTTENTADVYHLTGTAGFFPNNYSKDRFVEYYLGFPMRFASDEEVAAIMAQPEFAEMACYPYYGSMKFVGDILVVKLS